MLSEIKALDLLAMAHDKTAWLVEVKDYRINQRTKPSDLGEEIARKVFSTLAALLPAKINANEADEKQMAGIMWVAAGLRTEEPAGQNRLHVPPTISDQVVDDDLTAGDTVDHTVGLERRLAVLFDAQRDQLFGVAATLWKPR